MAKKPPQLPQKLDELATLIDEIGGGWLAKVAIRACIGRLRIERIADKLAEVADAAVDDHFTSVVTEWTVEPKVRSVARDMARQVVEALDRWAR